MLQRHSNTSSQATREICPRTNKAIMSTAAGVPNARKAWNLFKIYAALKDMPEVLPLIPLVGGGLALGVYTLNRMYFGIEGGAIPSKEMRADMERQISFGQEHSLHKPSLLYQVAQLRKEEDGSIDVSIYPFKNKSYKHDHVAPYHQYAAKGVPAEGASPTEY